MKTTTATFSSVGVAGLVTTALLAWPITSAFAADDAAMKRDDSNDRMAGTNTGGDTNSRSRNTSG